jgi:hypothetical protein
MDIFLHDILYTLTHVSRSQNIIKLDKNIIKGQTLHIDIEFKLNNLNTNTIKKKYPFLN